ncbi:MAG: hypothetical protein L0Y67_00690 [Gammaproteobacteria bacterium]|nr:hypothetical protein [Gammaproteobacteria bacterium]
MARRQDVVVLAVYVLGGDAKSIDTEEVAVKCHELAPGMFSWQKYPEQINLELVRVRLSEAKNPKCGALLTGSGRQGWRLSAKGLRWATSRGKELLREGLQWNTESQKAGSVDTVRKRREKTRLFASSAWKNWSDGQPLSVRDARDLFRIDEYSTGKMLEIKVVRLQSLFEDDEAMGRFLKEAGNLVLETGERE